MKNSPINFFNLKPFIIEKPRLNAFEYLGKDKNTKGLVHVVYLHRTMLSSTNVLDIEPTVINPYCKQFVIKNSGLVVGSLFVSRNELTKFTDYQLIVGQMKTTEGVSTHHILEKHHLLLFKSLDGSALVVARHYLNNGLVAIRQGKDDLKVHK
jgi:hypothetical protein